MSNEISVKEAKMCIDGGAIVLDVRTKEEFDGGHIEGSKNIDIHSVTFKEQVEKFDKSRGYVVYCASGGRSAKATQIMLDSGFGDVHSLLGGLAGWKKEGMLLIEE
jgi:rhodanese-related sulfurtransferase